MAKLSLLSLTQLQQLTQSEPMSTSTNHQSEPGSGHGQWAWNPNAVRAREELDESWEVRAFAEDYTGSVSGSTWPPRSYACTFCKREFRSAQALGGHMNVHRRDRATKRLHRHLPPSATINAIAAAGAASSSSTSSASTLVIPARGLANLNGGFCFLYQLPPQSDTPVQLMTTIGSSRGKIEVSSAQTSNYQNVGYADGCWNKDDGAEDLDLELRLGRRPPRS